MTKRIKDLHYRVCDKGLFLPIARRLAREAGRVSYWTPVEKSFPVVADCFGDGFDDIERVHCFLEDADSVDCWVFPDVGFGGIQQMLREAGVPVWGSNGGCELEVYRGKFLDELKKMGLPVPKHERIQGLSLLRKHLRDRSDVWVKCSLFRGDWETFHWRSEAEDGNALDEKAVRLGPFGEQIAFYVFDRIDAIVEDGCDSWCIDGKFPGLVIHGVEEKDKAFIGTFRTYDDLPDELRVVNDAVAPVLERYGYRSFFSTEVRITEAGDSFFTDPTCRAGSPPSQCQAEMIGNYAEVIWAGANGECIDPDPAAKFGVQALCDFHRDEKEWQYVKLNDDLDRWVKSANCFGHHGMLALPPGHHTGCEDWLVGIGDTISEAIRHLKRNAKLLPEGCTCNYESMADVLREVDEAEAKGIEFTDEPVPRPESVIKS